MRGELAAWLGRDTLILMPGFGVPAFPHRQRRFETPAGGIDLLDAVRLVSPANLLGLPSMAVPILAGDGLAPAGIQLMGPPDSEESILATARRLEAARGPLPGPPGS
jgi:Asp-tRNA(Asn)/Glu-tRNA(Gln) amidotransferase A subunit family amidase